MLKLGNATYTKDGVLVIYDEELEAFSYAQLKDYDKLKEDVKVPSNEITPTNIVSNIPKDHTILDFINFASLPTWTLSDILEITTSTAIKETIGKITVTIVFEINWIIKSIIGSNRPPVVMLPV